MTWSRGGGCGKQDNTKSQMVTMRSRSDSVLEMRAGSNWIIEAQRLSETYAERLFLSRRRVQGWSVGDSIDAASRGFLLSLQMLACSADSRKLHTDGGARKSMYTLMFVAAENDRIEVLEWLRGTFRAPVSSEMLSVAPLGSSSRLWLTAELAALK